MNRFERPELNAIADKYGCIHSEVVGDSRTVFYHFDIRNYKGAWDFYAEAEQHLKDSELAPFQPYEDRDEREYLVVVAPDSESKHYKSDAQIGMGSTIESSAAELPTSNLRLDWLEQDEK
jgi:hypothetical protein